MQAILVIPCACMAHLRLTLVLNSGARIGPGKAALLESVQTSGSISAAARAMGMDYKRVASHRQPKSGFHQTCCRTSVAKRNGRLGSRPFSGQDRCTTILDRTHVRCRHDGVGHVRSGPQRPLSRHRNRASLAWVAISGPTTPRIRCISRGARCKLKSNEPATRTIVRDEAASPALSH
jgi:hypothetical protein